jgi:hypothetical protein
VTYYPRLVELPLVFELGCFICREVLNQTLQLIQQIIKGAAMYLPMFSGPQVEGW